MASGPSTEGRVACTRSAFGQVGVGSVPARCGPGGVHLPLVRGVRAERVLHAAVSPGQVQVGPRVRGRRFRPGRPRPGSVRIDLEDQVARLHPFAALDVLLLDEPPGLDLDARVRVSCPELVGPTHSGSAAAQYRRAGAARRNGFPRLLHPDTLERASAESARRSPESLPPTTPAGDAWYLPLSEAGRTGRCTRPRCYRPRDETDGSDIGGSSVAWFASRRGPYQSEGYPGP